MDPKTRTLLNQFIAHFTDGRDAMPRQATAEMITKDILEEIAWELGYEGEDFDRHFARFAPLAVYFGADLRGEFAAGRAGAPS